MDGILIYLIVVVIIAVSTILFLEFRITKLYGPNASTSFERGVFVGMLFTIMLAPGVMTLVLEKEPTAIDVYRGKTDIEIQHTIVNDDTVSCDTTVIFKLKNKTK